MERDRWKESAPDFLNDSSCLFDLGGDLVELAGLDHVALDHPGTAAAEDLVALQILESSTRSRI